MSLNVNCPVKLDKMTKNEWFSFEFIKYKLIFGQKTVTKTYLAYSMIGIRIGLILPQTKETSVAKICPTSAITDRVNGIPIIAKRMLKARPATVTGAIFP